MNSFSTHRPFPISLNDLLKYYRNAFHDIHGETWFGTRHIQSLYDHGLENEFWVRGVLYVNQYRIHRATSEGRWKVCKIRNDRWEYCRGHQRIQLWADCWYNVSQHSWTVKSYLQCIAYNVLCYRIKERTYTWLSHFNFWKVMPVPLF